MSTLSLVAVACATTPSVAAPSEAEAIRQIKSIALPPVILPGGVHNEGVSKAAFEQLTLSLALKGYVMHRVDGLVPDARIDPATLRDLSPEALADLLPDSSSHYLVCWIDDALANTGASAANPDRLRASAVLIDRNQKRVLWRNYALLPSSDPLNAKWAAFVGALMLEVASPQPDFYTPIMRQIEFENRLSRLEQGYQMMESMASPVAIMFRALLSNFPERPMQ